MILPPQALEFGAADAAAVTLAVAFLALILQVRPRPAERPRRRVNRWRHRGR